MLPGRFYHYELRTTNVDDARSFYAHVLGDRLWGAEVSVAPLPEQAAARGAPAHWLGHVAVSDVQAALQRIVALGGQQLGAVRPSGLGGAAAAVRDPFGAVLGVSSGEGASAGAPQESAVAFRMLHVREVEGALAWYAELFGWVRTERSEWGGTLGRHQSFAWAGEARGAGTIADTANLPQVHPHWLYGFRVADLERGLAAVRQRGGTTLAPVGLPRGGAVAACEDAQGAAFALYGSH